MTTLNLQSTSTAGEISTGFVYTPWTNASIGDTDATNELRAARFTGFTIPAGVTIDTAVMQIAPMSTSDEPNHPFWHDDSGGAPADFTTGSGGDLESRPETTAQITWSSTNLGGNIEGTTYFSLPDSSALVQELVDTHGDITVIVSICRGSSSATRDLQPGFGTVMKYDITYTAPSSFVPRLSLLGVG